jgi:phytoene dehydrogenase-like protein
MAKTVVGSYLKNKSLIEMIFCPLLIYGSAWENDMDFSQFVIMFKSIFFEGFGRPCGGVRTIIDLLHKKLSENGVEIHYKSEVTKILSKENKIVGVEINREKEVFAKQVLSSIGLPETFQYQANFKIINLLKLENSLFVKQF